VTSSGVTREHVSRACRRLPGAQLSYPFNEETAVYKVAERIFAIVSEGVAPDRVTLKCDPDYGSYLVQQFEQITPGYHMNKRHWITVALTSHLSQDLVDQLVVDSYELIVAALPVREREALASAARDGGHDAAR